MVEPPSPSFTLHSDKWDLSIAFHPRPSARTRDSESLSLAGDIRLNFFLHHGATTGARFR